LSTEKKLGALMCGFVFGAQAAKPGGEAEE